MGSVRPAVQRRTEQSQIRGQAVVLVLGYMEGTEARLIPHLKETGQVGSDIKTIISHCVSLSGEAFQSCFVDSSPGKKEQILYLHHIYITCVFMHLILQMLKNYLHLSNCQLLQSLSPLEYFRFRCLAQGQSGGSRDSNNSFSYSTTASTIIMHVGHRTIICINAFFHQFIFNFGYYRPFVFKCCIY